jgi:hypothetical protein
MASGKPASPSPAQFEAIRAKRQTPSQASTKRKVSTVAEFEKLRDQLPQPPQIKTRGPLVHARTSADLERLPGLRPAPSQAPSITRFGH